MPCIKHVLRAAALSPLLLCLTTLSAAAQVGVHVRAGATASTTVVRDLVATPQVRQLLGGRVDEDVRVAAAPGATVGLAVRVPLRPRLALDAGADWTFTELRARAGGATRSLQDLSVAQGTAAVSWAVARAAEFGVAIGVLGYITEERGLFADGSSLSPLVEVRTAWTLPALDGRVALAGSAQLHRFGTPAMRQSGGEDGTVGRIALLARVRLLEVGR